MLVDSYSRRFSYLRLSVTEKCNFKCSYCLPNGYKPSSVKAEFLNLDEIYNLATAFKDLGVNKIRLTGGEPTLRADIVEIVRLLKQEIGIETVALTTNGYRLRELLEPLKQAGLDALNVSLDSLYSDKFKEICGSNLGEEIKNNIDLAIELGIAGIKINSVLLKDYNDDELDTYLQFVKSRKVSVRFIELMRTGDNKDYFEKHHIPLSGFAEKLNFMGWVSQKSLINSGPAKEYSHHEYVGKIGFISPYGSNFCSGCNRLRVSARGSLKLCLFGEGDVSLRELLQKKSQTAQLKELIFSSLQMKPQAHRLHENIYGVTHTLSSIGG